MRHALIACLVVLPMLIGANVLQFAKERHALSGAIATILSSHPSAEAVPALLQEAVRERVRASDGPIDQVQRPFLRQTAWETWTTREGFCGESARLLVNMLMLQGITATRVNLSSDSRDFSHTAVLYRRAGVWYLLDSTNSPDGFFAWSQSDRRPFYDMVHYTLRGSRGGAYYVSQNPFFTRYNFVDLSRIVGPSIELNLLHAPSYAATMLLENPPLIRAAALTIGWVVAAALLLIVARRRPMALAV